jgi:transposase
MQTTLLHAESVEEVVADKGYHSNEAVRDLRELKVRSYIAEPERGPRSWEGREAAKAAVYANRRRIGGQRGNRSTFQTGYARDDFFIDE